MECPVCQHENASGARFCAGCGAPLAQIGTGPGLVGHVLGGRYVVTRVIAEGGMGVVYEAEQRLGGHTRRVAIKTLHPALSRDKTIVSRFFRECGMVAQLEHPNTIKIYDFGESSEGALYIAMEFVQGRSLSAAIEAGPMPLERARHILRQICGALQEAHAQGIIHRDLKPDNIVLTDRSDEPDFLKLLDFGIATRVGKDAAGQTKLTQQGVVLGTPPYMSPEQMAGKPLDARSDIYSLGVISYEMLTGKLPFEADSAFEWAKKHMTETPRPMPTLAGRPIPPSAERAVMRALAKSPADRQATALDFYRDLSGDESRASVGVTARDRTAGSAGADAHASAAPARTADQVPQPEHTDPMARPPLLVPMPERTAVGPAVLAHGYGTGAAVAAPIPPPPPPRRSSATGWVIGLSTLAALIALALGVAVFAGRPDLFAGRGGSGGVDLGAPTATDQTELDPAVSVPTSTPTLPPEIEPEVRESKPPPRKPPTQPTATQPTATQPTATQPPATQPPPPATQPPPPATQPPPTQPPPRIPPKETPPSGPQGDVACRQADSAASGLNIEGAVGLYRQCQQTGGSALALANTKSKIRAQSVSAVRNRARQPDCPGALSAVRSAESIGAGEQARRQYGQLCG